MYYFSSTKIKSLNIYGWQFLHDREGVVSFWPNLCDVIGSPCHSWIVPSEKFKLNEITCCPKQCLLNSQFALLFFSTICLLKSTSFHRLTSHLTSRRKCAESFLTNFFGKIRGVTLMCRWMWCTRQILESAEAGFYLGNW